MKRLFCIIAMAISFSSCKKDIQDELIAGSTDNIPVNNGLEPVPPYTWKSIALDPIFSMNNPDGNNIVVPVNNTVYCLIGFPNKSLFKLNNLTKEWHASNDFVYNQGSQYLFSYQSKAYFGLTEANHTIFTGFHSQDILTGIKTTLASFPGTPVTGAVSFVIGNKGYIMSGEALGSVLINQLWEYDFAGNQWTNKGNSPIGKRASACAFVIDNKAYIGLGYDYGSSNGPQTTFYKNDWIEYNPVTGDIVAKTNFPALRRARPEGFVINNAAYVGFGYNATTHFSDFWKYSVSANTWTQQESWPGNVSNAYNNINGFSIGNTGYIVKGDLTGFWRFSNSVFF